MRLKSCICAVFALLSVSSEPASAWNFAVWPGADASQWAPGLGLTNVVGVAAGADRTIFVRSDGSIVWSWGASWHGADVAKVSSWCHDLLLLRDGTVMDWGLEGCAGSAPYTTVPTGLSNVVAIAAGDRHSLVLKQDGTCVSWGWMTVGSGPAYVPDGLSNVVAVAAGFDTSGVIKSDGSVLAWGYPDYGGTAAPTGLTDALSIAMGHHHGLVLRSNGVVANWGTTPPAGLTNVTRIAAQQTWSMVLKSDGHLVAWNDGIGSQHNTPNQPLTNVIDLAAGSYHGVVLAGDGPPQPLWILSNQVAIAGNAVTFMGEALGTEPLSYQWLHNGTNLSGAVSPTLSLSNIVPADAGTYSVVLSNAFGTTTNSGGSLTVLPLVIDYGPTNVSLFGGDTYLNSVFARGSGLSYQWRHGNADLPGETNALLNLPDVTTNAAGAYSVVITNRFGAVESSAATLEVVPLRITYEPSDRTVYVGEETTFTCRVEKNGPFTFQWRFNGVDLPGENNQTLTLSNILSQQTGSYAVFITNPYGSILSSNSLLTVLDSAPVLVSQPKDAATWPGGVASLAVSATGSKPLSYQWRLNGTNLPGATNSTLTISNATAEAAGTYSVRVTNALGNLLTPNAKLTLVPVVLWPTELLTTMPLTAALTNTAALSAGGAFSLALKCNGTVLAWGANDQGQTRVPAGLTNVAALAAGNAHSLALRTNGTLVSWGSNSYGQTNVPGNLSNVVDIAATDVYSTALRKDGTAVAWGRVDYNRATAAVPGMDWNGITAIAAGDFHRLGLRCDGMVVGWVDYFDYGWNRVPVGVTNVVAIAAGSRHSLALKADGSVIAWGDTSYGLTNIPSGLSNVVTIACGSYHNLALKADGSVVGWGFPAGYGLTNAPPTKALLAGISASGHNLGVVAATDPMIVRPPHPVTAAPLQSVLLSVAAISARPLSCQWQLNGQNITGATNASYRIATVTQASQGDYRVVVSNELGIVTSAPARLNVAGVLAWGSNTYKQTNVPTGLNVSAVGGGFGHSLGLRGDGKIVAWGTYNTLVTNVPAAASNVTQMAVGPYHNLALKSDGKVVAWGSGSSVNVPGNLTNVVAIAAGESMSVALRSDGTVATWGSFNPPAWGWLSNAVSVAAGRSFEMALRSDGSVVTWNAMPPPPDLSNVVAIAAASATAAALKADGTVVTWGSVPLAAPADLTNVVAISAGSSHMLALKSDGTIAAWGSDTYGQATVPPGWSNVVGIAGGYAHSLMLVDGRDPVIVREPANARAYTGSQVLFSAGVRSFLPLQFQWQHNGIAIPGATQPSLLLPWVHAADAGLYSLTASNALGTVSSSAVSLSIFDQKPFIRAEPRDLSVGKDEAAVFQVTAEGSDPKTYQWKKDGVAIEGATASTLAISNLHRADEGLFSVTVSNAFGFIASRAALLRVIVPQKFQSPITHPDGSISLLFGDNDGGSLGVSDLAHFQIMGSTNLLDWQTLTNSLTLTNGMLQFFDTIEHNRPTWFYRAVELP